MPIFAFWLSLAGTLALVLSASLALQLMPGIGLYGRKRAERLARQPWVDVLVLALVAMPWVVAFVMGGVAGVFGACSGQMLGAIAFSFIHKYSQTQRQRTGGPIQALAKRIGAGRTYAALFLSLAALPLLITMRVMQMTIWPIFAGVLKLPREPHRAYFSFTRHQTKGLIGLDLLWALYAEWAIGVWSMSAQIMRHAASLWCPMRFGNDAKNKACVLDFPDIERWAEPCSLEGAVRVIEQMHSRGRTSWFGHASRAAAPETPAQAGESPESDDARQAA